MIPFFCPTKNRAPQCRLLLESINRNAPGIFKPYVMWTADEQYRAGYEKLQEEQFVKDMGATFVKEENFVDQLYEFLFDAGEYFGLFMDDCIFYKRAEFTKSDILSYLNGSTWCVSLRLGYNTIVQDYLNNIQQKPINPESSRDGFIWWDFNEHHGETNYGFHFSWDGVVYRTKDVLNIFNNTDFKNTSNQWAIAPQRIENYMMNRRGDVPYKLMCSPEISHVVCMYWNSTHPHAVGGRKFGGGMEEMQELYMNNYVIDLDSIDFSNIRSCHDELSFTYRKL